MEAGSSTEVEAPAGKASQMCDVCGLDVAPDEAVTSEVSVAGAMCPTPMTFHQPCFEAASAMWTPDPDSYCLVDDRFPETKQWDRMQAQADSAPPDS